MTTDPVHARILPQLVGAAFTSASGDMSRQNRRIDIHAAFCAILRTLRSYARSSGSSPPENSQHG